MHGGRLSSREASEGMDKDALLNAVYLALSKALSHPADGMLEGWAAGRKVCLNVEELRMELLLNKATLETTQGYARGRQIAEDYLEMLHYSAEHAGSLLEELDNYRIHEELHGTNEGGVLKAVKLACLPLPACWSAASPGEAGEVQDRVNEIDFSLRMKNAVHRLQHVRRYVYDILLNCDRKAAQDISQSAITIDQNMEPRSYRSYNLVYTIQHAVSKALTLHSDGKLEVWALTKHISRYLIIDLQAELHMLMPVLDTCMDKQISGLAIEGLLLKLRDLVDSAKDLLGELDYLGIQDEHRTYKGGVHNLFLNAHHTAKAVGKLKCLPGGCMPKLGKLIPCSSSPHVHVDNSLCGAPQRRRHAGEEPVLKFNSVHVSERMKHIVEQLRHVNEELTRILDYCHHRTVRDIAQIHHITTAQTTTPKLYGRDHIMNTIIHDITKGKYCDKRLTVLPVVGPGGIGKTALIQHIYHDQQVQKHFPVMIWISVSLFNLCKVLQEIKESISQVEGEEESRLEGLIEQRLKSKRFLLVLDGIWRISDVHDWEKLLLLLKTSQENGSMVLVTTRSPSVTRMVGTTHHSIELEGLETEEFRKLFFTSVFGNEQCGRDHSFLLPTADKIMDKLKGSPLAANTIGSLLRKDLNLHHWKMLLENKEWRRQTGIDDTIPSLKLSYEYLPFSLRQCLSYSALFPEDFRFSSNQLINLWIGFDILEPGARNKAFEDVGFNYLNELVIHGFFREEETNGCTCYVMSDLLRDFVLQIASHECLTLHHSNAGPVDIPPGIRHLSIIIDDDNTVSGESLETKLRKLKTRLKVRQLQTLMIFGEIDENFANIFGDMFRDANALRVLHLHELSYPVEVESILHSFSTLFHLRYLFIRTNIRRLMHTYSVSFKQLKCVQLLDLDGCRDLDNSAMDDICLLIKLKYLSLKQTQITNLPPQIGKLQDLETLDVRQTQVKELPKEVLQLPKLTHLHFGQSGCFGVKLPVGIDQLESVQVMGIVDSRECSESVMKEISKLVEVRELEVVLYDGPSDTEKNDKLLSSICKCSKLKSLIIYGDSKPCDKLPPESSNFPQLEMLKVAGRLVKVPGWIAQLRNLTTLVIRVCNLEENTLVIVGGLPRLRVLALALVAVPRKQVTITSSAGFAMLEVFCFDCRVPWVSFEEKAMPNLQHLQLQLYRGPADKVPSGIMLLERLNMVTLLYSSKYASSDSVFETVAVVREDACSHANLIELSINGDREIFPSNRSADRGVAGPEFRRSANTIAEIEEVQPSE